MPALGRSGFQIDDHLSARTAPKPSNPVSRASEVIFGRKSRNLDQFPDGVDQPPPCQVALQVGLLRGREHHLCLASIQGFSGLVDTRSAFFMFRFIKRDGHQARLFHQLARIVHFDTIHGIGVGVGIEVECRGDRFRRESRHPRHRSSSFWL